MGIRPDKARTQLGQKPSTVAITNQTFDSSPPVLSGTANKEIPTTKIGILSFPSVKCVPLVRAQTNPDEQTQNKNPTLGP